MSFIAQIKNTVAEHDLVADGDRILIALSGGPDSVALFRALVSLRKSRRLTLTAVYVNHGLRPKAAKGEETFCRQLCDKHKVELIIDRVKIKKLAEETGGSIEEVARNYRYKLFENLADELPCDRVALGHHRGDRAETVLFRIVRGTGPDGLAGMPPGRGRIIRPLYDVTRDDILDYLTSLKQPWCEDRSNRDIRFSRNLLRLKILPVIRERLNPKIDDALISLSELITDENEYLEAQVDRAVKKCVETTPGGKLSLDLASLRPYDTVLIRRLLRRCLVALSDNAMPPPRDTVERLIRRLDQTETGLSVSGTVHAAIERGRLYLVPTEQLRFQAQLAIGGRIRFERPAIELRCREETNRGKGEPERRANTVRLDRDSVHPPLTVRSIKPGDRFRPLNMRGTKKVGDLLTDRKAPATLRDEIPVVCDTRGIIWLVGYEIADRVKIDTATRKVLVIEYHRKTRSATTLL